MREGTPLTPFGAHLRQLRAARSMTAAAMARAVGVTPTYLAALERGRRGRPSWALVQRIIGHLGVIWDEAAEIERLAMLSHPRIMIDTSELAPEATLLANRLSRRIGELTPEALARMQAILDEDDAGAVVSAARRAARPASR